MVSLGDKEMRPPIKVNEFGHKVRKQERNAKREKDRKDIEAFREKHKELHKEWLKRKGLS